MLEHKNVFTLSAHQVLVAMEIDAQSFLAFAPSSGAISKTPAKSDKLSSVSNDEFISKSTLSMAQAHRPLLSPLLLPLRLRRLSVTSRPSESQHWYLPRRRRRSRSHFIFYLNRASLICQFYPFGSSWLCFCHHRASWLNNRK